VHSQQALFLSAPAALQYISAAIQGMPKIILVGILQAPLPFPGGQDTIVKLKPPPNPPVVATVVWQCGERKRKTERNRYTVLRT